MGLYKITYFAPYTFANFSVQAKSAEEGRKKKEAFNDKKGYSIENRDIKTETFDGKKIMGSTFKGKATSGTSKGPVNDGIWGDVIVKGKEYQDEEIADLVGKNITGWKYGGDQGFDASDIAVTINGVSKSFSGKKGLPEALKFIASATKKPAPAKSAGLSKVKRDSKGKESIKGVSKRQLKGFEPPKTSAKKPASGGAINKAKVQLRAVNASIAKLKNVKAVQTYIKLAKAQARLKATLS
jgi:hypothetical protein